MNFNIERRKKEKGKRKKEKSKNKKGTGNREQGKRSKEKRARKKGQGKRSKGKWAREKEQGKKKRGAREQGKEKETERKKEQGVLVHEGVALFLRESTSDRTRASGSSCRWLLATMTAAHRPPAIEEKDSAAQTARTLIEMTLQWVTSHDETQVLALHGLHPEAARSKGCDHCANFQLMKDRGFINGIKPVSSPAYPNNMPWSPAPQCQDSVRRPPLEHKDGNRATNSSSFLTVLVTMGTGQLERPSPRLQPAKCDFCYPSLR